MATMKAILIMGVSGCGKSTLGGALAKTLGWRFVEGDTLHPPSNVAKMAAGVPLDDDDRRPFLAGVAAALVAGREHGVVVTCSALKRSYRDYLRSAAGDVVFVLPDVGRQALAARLAARDNHYMPASLLDSQLAALEPPTADEHVVVVDGNAPTAAQLASVRAVLAATPNATREAT
jgi:carbohydrate kinase (thermoresistant glucokinase family)